MTGRAAAVQGGLAALGLLAAHLTWQREPDRAPGEVVVVDASKNDLGSVHFEDEANAIDIERRSEGGESAVWLHIAEKPPAPPPTPATPTPAGGAGGAGGGAAVGAGGAGGAGGAKAAVATKPPPPPKPVKPPRDLRGDTSAEKLLDQLTPLRSPRSFGVLDDKKVKELGLDVAKKRLVITVRGQPHEFVIGQPQSGTGENYLRDVKDGRTFLMPRAVLSDLQGASFRLVDRRLHTFKVADVDRIVVTVGGKTQDLKILNRESQNGYKLAPAKTPDKPEEMARNWHDKIWRIYPVEILGKGEKPTPSEPKVTLRVEYFDGKKSAGFIEVGKVDAPPAPPVTESAAKAPEPPKPDLYARTEHTAGWIKIHNDPSYVTDGEKVASGPQ